MVRKFYANSTDIDFDSHTLILTVCGMNVELSPSHVSNLMGVPRVSNPQYPFNEHVGPTDYEVNQELTNDVYCLPTNLTHDLPSPLIALYIKSCHLLLPLPVVSQISLVLELCSYMLSIKGIHVIWHV
ncbi:hypothetical protein U1Q18_028076 [Sarracenia purpurea var. burkii]